MPSLRQLALPGVFVLLCVVLTLFTWRSFGGRTPLEARGYRVAVVLPDASNVFAGSDVRAAGVTIGRVVSVRREGRRARLVAEIDRAYAPLHAGTRVTTRSKTLLGEGYVQLAPGLASAPVVADGATLPSGAVVAAQRLDDVLDTFRPQTRARLRSLMAGLAAAFRGTGPAVNRALGDSVGAARGTDVVLATLDAQQVRLQQLLAGSADVMDALGARQGALASMLRAGDRVLTTTGREQGALAATVRAFPPFLRQLRRTADALGAASTDVAPAAAALAEVAPRVGPALREIRRSSPEFRRLFAELSPVLDAADAGLPALRRIATASGPALDAVYPVLREMIPVLRLLAAARDSAVTTFAGVGQIHNGTYVGPDDRVLHYANGVITLWNESIGGWVRRLPSNRGNTYPKPGFLDGIRHGGLQSYDCRHVHNPDVLPPFGGTPPCVEQGAWTYDGATRFYPHLLPAPP